MTLTVLALSIVPMAQATAENVVPKSNPMTILGRIEDAISKNKWSLVGEKGLEILLR